MKGVVDQANTALHIITNYVRLCQALTRLALYIVFCAFVAVRGGQHIFRVRAMGAFVLCAALLTVTAFHDCYCNGITAPRVYAFGVDAGVGFVPNGYRVFDLLHATARATDEINCNRQRGDAECYFFHVFHTVIFLLVFLVVVVLSIWRLLVPEDSCFSDCRPRTKWLRQRFDIR